MIPTSAYIHVPFCLHRCGYCDFTVITDRDDLIDAYLDCLAWEFQQTLTIPRPMQTVFIGGGTPSYLSALHLRRLLELIAEWFPLQACGEYSIECNPEQFTSERMDEITAAGVNRISLGVQAFDAEHLRTLERSHVPETVADVVARLRARGAENLAFDLIFGVPGQTVADWERTLAIALELAPVHLSTYGLTFEKGTAFWGARQKGWLRAVDEESERSMYALTMDVLPGQGFAQYELSNFARAGFECRHNQVYWRAEPYYGFGPGAANYVDGVRATNHRSVTTWIKRIQAGEHGIADREELSLEVQRREAVMLGLRQTIGIDEQHFMERFEVPVRDLAPKAYDRFLEANLLERAGGQLRLTQEGRFIADSIMAEFL